MTTPRQVTVALPLPIRKTFTYLLPPGIDSAEIPPGVRVLVPFGKRRLLGFVCENETQNRQENRAYQLKSVEKILDRRPVYSKVLYQLLVWAADYYQTPLGMVLEAALPVALRRGKEAKPAEFKIWRVTEKGERTDPTTLAGHVQRSLLETLIIRKEADAETLRELGFKAASLTSLASLEKKNLIASKKTKKAKKTKKSGRMPAQQIKSGGKSSTSNEQIILTESQLAAAKKITEAADKYGCYLLEGPTNSGKTEVYIEVIKHILKTNGQVLYLVPEINLSPQTVARLQESLKDMPLGVLNSKMSNADRLQNYLLASSGKFPVLVGTRSAIFTPMPNLRCILIDEEQDNSYKQQDNFHYNGKHLAIKYAQLLKIPVVLGSATPSLESLHNTARGYYHSIELPPLEKRKKKIVPLDISGRYAEDPLPDTILLSIEDQLKQKKQVLVFVNRRGFATVVRCQKCGWIQNCKSCDKPMILHKNPPTFVCHLCDRRAAAGTRCPNCNSDQLLPIGSGTQRVEEFLRRKFPDYPVLRIDRDSMRAADSHIKFYQTVHNAEPSILVGTQMLAKGHDFSNIFLGIIVNCDQGLINPDFYAKEAFAQTLIQVIGRIGRRAPGRETAGEVIIPTCYPNNEFLRSLVGGGYGDFARHELEQRKRLGLPPYSYLAYLRAENKLAAAAFRFLEEVKQQTQNALQTTDEGFLSKDILGPNECVIAKKADYYRAALVIKSTSRKNRADITQKICDIAAKKHFPGTRWFLNTDPIEAA